MLLFSTALKTGLSVFIGAPIVVLLLILLLPAILVLFVVHSFIRLLAWTFRPDLDGAVRGINSIFTLKTPTNLIFTLSFKGKVTADQVRSSFKKRIFNFRDPKQKCDYSKGLTRTWRSFLGYAFWKSDPDFDLKNHIRRYDYGGKRCLPIPPTLKDVQRVVGTLEGAPWDERRSPWEILVLENFLDEREGNKNRGSAIIVRINHVLLDGYGVLRMLKELTQSPFKVPRARFGKRKFPVWKALGLMLKMPWDLAQCLTALFYHSPLGQGRKYSNGERLITFSPFIDVTVVKRIKDYFGVSFAAVTYAALFGALRNVWKDSGETFPRNIVVGFVLPSKERTVGIEMNLTVMPAVWSTHESTTPEDGLRTMNHNLKSMSQSTLAAVVPIFVRTGSYMPIFLREAFIKLYSSRLSLGITSFPVTTEPDYFQGCEIVNGGGALGSFAKIRCIATVGGLNHKQTMAFSLNKSYFPSEDSAYKLGAYVEKELEAMLAATA